MKIWFFLYQVWGCFRHCTNSSFSLKNIYLAVSSLTEVHGLLSSCGAHVGSKFPNPGSHPHPLHRKVDSQPLDYLGSHHCTNIKVKVMNYLFSRRQFHCSGFILCFIIYPFNRPLNRGCPTFKKYQQHHA